LGLKVSGNVAPETLYPAPDIETEFTVNTAVPVDERVKVCAAVVFTFRLPKERLELLRFKVGTDEPNWMAKVWATLPMLAVNVTVCEELTAEAVAVKPALAAPAGTVTEAGTVTPVLLLDRLTTNPPVGAAAFSVTVQLSVPVPVIEPLLQLTAVSTGTPVPVKPMVEVDPTEELLVTINVPAAEPDTVGLNCTDSVAVWLGFKVSGNVAPETVNPLPDSEMELTVTAAPPVDVNVIGCVMGVPTFALPKARLELLMVKVGTDAPS
jgi:hypothetical protein